jgi:acyl carrier protein
MNLNDKILDIVRANTSANGEITLASDLRKQLHLDSFGTLMIINAIEDSFGITVEDADFSRVITVADIVTLLQSKYQCP